MHVCDCGGIILVLVVLRVFGAVVCRPPAAAFSVSRSVVLLLWCVGSVLNEEVTDKMDPSLPQQSRSRGVCGFIQSCPGLQLRSLVCMGFPGNRTTREDKDGEKRWENVAHHWIRCQPRSLKRERVTPRKSLQSSFYLGQAGS